LGDRLPGVAIVLLAFVIVVIIPPAPVAVPVAALIATPTAATAIILYEGRQLSPGENAVLVLVELGRVVVAVDQRSELLRIEHAVFVFVVAVHVPLVDALHDVLVVHRIQQPGSQPRQRHLESRHRLQRVENLKAGELLGGEQHRLIIIAAAAAAVVIIVVAATAAAIIAAPLPAALHPLGQVLNPHRAIQTHAAPLQKRPGLFGNFARFNDTVAVSIKASEHPAGVESSTASEPAATSEVTASAESSPASEIASAESSATSESSTPTEVAAATKSTTAAEPAAFIIPTTAATLCNGNVSREKDGSQQYDNWAEAMHVQ
jgi:hypothetical protein